MGNNEGRNAVVQLLADHGAKLDQHDLGGGDTGNGDIRVGVQSAIPHPETAALLRKLMADKGLEIPPPITFSICITQVCKATPGPIP